MRGECTPRHTHTHIHTPFVYFENVWIYMCVCVGMWHILPCDSLSCHFFCPHKPLLQGWISKPKGLSLLNSTLTSRREQKPLHAAVTFPRNKFMSIAVVNRISVTSDLLGWVMARVFRCAIGICWDLITFTDTKIPFKRNCSQKNNSSYISGRLFLFFSYQQLKANSCFHDGRQEAPPKKCSFTLIMLIRISVVRL